MGSSGKKVVKKVANVATLGVYGAMNKASRAAAASYDAQEAAIREQIDAMKASEAANVTVQAASDPTATMQNAAANSAIQAENEDALRRRRLSLQNTYNSSSRLYGALTGKNVLGG